MTPHTAINCLVAGSADGANFLVACAAGHHGGRPHISTCDRCAHRRPRDPRHGRRLKSEVIWIAAPKIEIEGPKAWLALFAAALENQLTHEKVKAIIAPVRRCGCDCRAGIDAWLRANPLPLPEEFRPGFLDQAHWVWRWKCAVNHKKGRPNISFDQAMVEVAGAPRATDQ